MSAAGVRAGLVERLRRNLIGPSEAADGDLAEERLPAGESPSRWYLSGFIAPSGELAAEPDIPADAELEEIDSFLPELDGFSVGGAAGDHDEPDAPPARRRFLPSAIGLSTMVDPGVDALEVCVTWGDYVPEPPLPPEMLESGGELRGTAITWRRVPRECTITLPLPGEGDGMVRRALPGSAATARPGGGLELAVRARPFRLRLATGEIDPRSRPGAIPWRRLPRTRGDRPFESVNEAYVVEAPPHPRGSTLVGEAFA